MPWKVLSFILHCFPFSFDWRTKRWEITKEMSINCMAYTYYVMLMAKCTYTWLHHPLKSYNKHKVFALYWFKSARMVSCWGLYACSWAVICQYSCCYNCYQALTTIDRYVMNYAKYKICSILCLNKIFLPVIYQYSYFFV